MANNWSSTDGVAHLERLSALRASGALSEEEFQEAKRAFISGSEAAAPAESGRKPLLIGWAIVGAVSLLFVAVVLLFPTTTVDERLQEAVAESDEYATHGSVMLGKARALVARGRCDVSDFEEAGGWTKSQSEGSLRFFVYCGGSAEQNRIYLDIVGPDAGVAAFAQEVPAAVAEPADPYAGAKLDSCRMDVCMWSKNLGIRTVRNVEGGVLKSQTTYEGRSEHADGEYAERYSRDVPIKWEKAPVTTYAFCSRAQPATAFKDRFEGGSGKWIGHLINLFDTYGYNYMSAQSYMRICHGIDFGQKDIERKLRSLGYLRGVASEQIDLGNNPESLGSRALAAKRAAQAGGSEAEGSAEAPVAE